MAQKLDRTPTRRAMRWAKWKGLRAVQLTGLFLVLVGAYPYLRPFIASVTTPPAVIDSVAYSLIPVAQIGGASVPTLRTVVFIAVGAVVMWLATSRRFH